MRPRPRVVHVTTSDISLELLLGPQLQAIAAHGYEVIGASAPGPYVDGLRRAGIEHVALQHATRAMAPGEDAQALVELVRLFRRLRPDIVHTHNPKPGLYGRIAAKIAHVPVIVNTVHGLYATPDDRMAKQAVVLGLERIAATCSDAELVQNPEDIPTLRRVRIPDERLHLLGNGIDLSRFDPSTISEEDRQAARIELGAESSDDIVVGLVGRLVREKGYPEVFEAAASLAPRFPHVRFAVIGPVEADKDDGLTSEEIDAAKRAGVRFLGSREDVERLYAGMDVHVLASHREGFPRSPMEAAAMGVPVVATDIRGCRQAVDHGITGVLVPAKSPAALADAIQSLVSDEGRRARMGAAAREKAQREFNDRSQIATTLSVYSDLLREAGRLSVPMQGAPDGVTFRTATVTDAPVLARMHADGIDEGFLPQLGPGFLTALYRRIARSPRAFALVAETDDDITGFVAVALDTGRLYREFLRHEGVPAAVRNSRRIAARLPRVLETLRYGAADDGDLPEAEVLSVAVDARAAGKGLGSALVTEAIGELRRRGVDEAQVVTAADNSRAQAMYRRAGFRPHSQTEVHAGTVQEVLVWP